ncbi:MAG: phenylalanine--tRNA ligase subunit alpha [Alphaproteobacteria bacterium]|nr:phenylalanine--tRNA ligase subunit alpha [Alphaproteobacteria bacterium]
MPQLDDKGYEHPITALIDEIAFEFSGRGYTIVLGNELETEKYNFDALNIPKDHPARTMHDTFWIKDKPGYLLRTHTSPVQIHYMEENKTILENEGTIKIIVPGKVFRNEATDATHEVQFHQCEGLVVGKNISIGHLKEAIESFMKIAFYPEVKLRYRSSYFPFTEPSMEVDICLPGTNRWLEVLGAGMVHKNVFESVGIDSDVYTGFAFGIGLERILMIRHNIDDVREFFNGDLRFSTQFK